LIHRLLSRRRFLGAAVYAGGYALALQKLQGCSAAPDTSASIAPVDDEVTGLPLIQLPDGFRYRSFSWAGEQMLGGYTTPAKHDGMGCVAETDGIITLVRNHERIFAGEPLAPITAYDGRAQGGTTTLRFDTRKGEWLDARASLAGTFANCAGGVTPWGTWLSCEEAVIEADGRLGPRFNNRVAELEQEHGYVFEVPADGVSDARPLKALGRFRHEAIAVDPTTGILYQTEDNQPRSGVYRFIPLREGSLDEGRLQMMAVRGTSDMRRDVPRDTWMDVAWVDIDDPGASHTPGTLDSAGVFAQGKRIGGATFARPEGCWYESGKVYFSDTTGGNAECGQIYEYEPAAERLRLIFESPRREVLDHPDNITTTPNGGLLICEDRPQRVQRMSALTRGGELVPFAANNVELGPEWGDQAGNHRNAEWAGACFSADGNWLFANIQEPGFSVAITGPWDSLSI
jgi:secreted PhoX family phosphatase